MNIFIKVMLMLFNYYYFFNFQKSVLKVFNFLVIPIVSRSRVACFIESNM